MKYTDRINRTIDLTYNKAKQEFDKKISDLDDWLIYRATFMEHLTKAQQKELFDKLREIFKKDWGGLRENERVSKRM